MADIATLESALKKADAAGDVEGAKVLASEIIRMRGETTEAPADRPFLGPGSYLSEITNAAARNLTLGLSDKAAAAGTATGKATKQQTVADLVTGPETFSDAYHTALENERSKGAQFKEENPALYQAGATPGFIASMLLAKGGVPASLGGKVLQGAKAGATYGALGSYGANSDENLENTASDLVVGGGTGALIGGAVPIAVEGVKGLANVGKRLAEPLYSAGRDRILRRFQDSLIGNDPSARGKIVSALQNSRELVQGSKPTAGEAVSAIDEATGLMAHQKAIARTPGVSPLFAAREAEQEGARLAAMDSVAGTKGALSAAINKRAGEASTNYGKAYAQAIKADSNLAKLSENPYFRDALPDALKLAEAKGLNSKMDLTEVLHYVKISLDKMLSRNGDTALASTEKSAVQGLQKDLIAWMGQKNPDYEAARAAFSSASKPINEMQVGQYLKDKIVAPLENTERAASFAQAVRDAPGTIMRSTGGPRFTELSQVLPPQKEAVVNAILADLQRKGAYQKLAGKTFIPGGSSIQEASTSGIRMPNLLSRPAMVANFVMKRIGEGADEKINALAAQQYLNPAKLADALKDVPVSQRGAIVEALLQRLGSRSAAEVNGGR